jgi:7,8-dihydroneopterin aldolase/epimerase/oxygenase
MLRNLIFAWSGTLTDDRGPALGPTNPVLLPHASQFLRFCQRTGRRVFLLSQIEQPRFVEQSARLGVAHFFEHVYFRATDGPGRIAEIVTENSLASHETAFIGDTPGEVEMARDGGLMVIATLTGLDLRVSLSRTKADVLVRDLGELQRVLEAVPPNDEIRVEELELMARVGVTAEERAHSQRLTVSITLQSPHSFSDLGDSLARTIDYAAVCQEVRRFVSERQDKLIETLANDLAEHLLRHFAIGWVELELRKFILPETRYVAVRVARGAARPC